MVSPAPVSPPAETAPQAMGVGLPVSETTTSRFIRTFGFHVLAVLLGIALAFM